MAENVLGLLFEISADPSRAEAALKQLQATQASVLNDMSAVSARAEREKTGILSQAENQRRLVIQSTQGAVLQADITPTLRKQSAEFNALAESATQGFNRMSGAAQGASGVMLRVLGQVAEQILLHMELQDLDVAKTAKAQTAKTALSVAAIKQLAIVKAAMEAAEAAKSLAELDFWGFAHHTAAAVLFGGVAGMQIAALAGGGGGGVRGPSAGTSRSAAVQSGGGSAPPALAPGTSSAQSSPPSGGVTVLVMGEPGAAKWLTQVINNGVVQNDLMLVSSHTKRSAPAGR